MSKKVFHPVSHDIMAQADLKYQRNKLAREAMDAKPRVPGTQAKTEKLELRQEFSERSRISPEIYEIVEVPKSMHIAGALLTHLILKCIGEEFAPLIDINFDSDTDRDIYIFEIYPKGFGDDPDLSLLSPLERNLYSNIKESIAAFLDKFEGAMDEEQGDVRPDDGWIFFENKMALFRTLVHYINNEDIPVIDIHNFQQVIQFSKKFAGHKLNPRQVQSELTGLRYAYVQGELGNSDNFPKDMLFSTFLKPYFNKRHYKADALITSCKTAFSTMLISTYVAMLRHQICLEDGLDSSRNYSLDIERYPLPPTIN